MSRRCSGVETVVAVVVSPCWRPWAWSAASGVRQPAGPAPAPIDYVALGDSFSAGPLVPDARSDPPRCFRSTNNYPRTSRATSACELPRRHLLRRPDPGPPAATADGLRPDRPAAARRPLRPHRPGHRRPRRERLRAVRLHRRHLRRRAGRDPRGAPAGAFTRRPTTDRSTPRRATPAGSRTGSPGPSRDRPARARRPTCMSWGTHACCRIAEVRRRCRSPPVTTRGAPGRTTAQRLAERGGGALGRDLRRPLPRLPWPRRLRGEPGLAQRVPALFGLAAGFHPFQEGMRGMAGAVHSSITGDPAPRNADAEPPPGSVVRNGPPETGQPETGQPDARN